MKQLPITIEKPHLGDDTLAVKESSLIEDETLDKQAKQNHHERQQKFLNHVSKAALIIFWLFIIIICIMTGCWAWNIVAPEALHFLSETQLDKLQTILFSALLGRIVPEFTKRFL